MIWHDKKLDLKQRKKVKKISKVLKYWYIKIEGIGEIGYLRREPVVGHISQNVLNIIINSQKVRAEKYISTEIFS